MADNTTLNTGSGGDTLATDDIGGVKYPRSKLVIGADGTNDGDVSAANPLPVKGTGTAGTANAGVLTVQGIASMTPVQIGDNSGSITVDWAGTAPPIGAGVEATALRVTLATDSTGVVSIDDNELANLICLMEEVFGALPFIFGTLVSSLIALLIASAGLLFMLRRARFISQNR